jgi:hypothetical protein
VLLYEPGDWAISGPNSAPVNLNDRCELAHRASGKNLIGCMELDQRNSSLNHRIEIGDSSHEIDNSLSGDA